MKRQNTQHQSRIDATRLWIENTVVKLNLCPFAKKELDRQAVSYFISDATTEIALLEELEQRLIALQGKVAVSTELLIHPWVLADFDDYNQFLNLADRLLEQMNLVGEFQIASFHPEYQFAGTSYADAENFTNRSPFPMLHILREEQVQKAVSAYPNVDLIPQRNIETMRQIGSEPLKKALIKLLDVN